MNSPADTDLDCEVSVAFLDWKVTLPHSPSLSTLCSQLSVCRSSSPSGKGHWKSSPLRTDSKHYLYCCRGKLFLLPFWIYSKICLHQYGLMTINLWNNSVLFIFPCSDYSLSGLWEILEMSPQCLWQTPITYCIMFSIFLIYIPTKCFRLLPVCFSSPGIGCFTKVSWLCPQRTVLEITPEPEYADEHCFFLPLTFTSPSSTACDSFPVSPIEEHVTSHLRSSDLLWLSFYHSVYHSIHCSSTAASSKAAHIKYYYKQEVTLWKTVLFVKKYQSKCFSFLFLKIL